MHARGVTARYLNFFIKSLASREKGRHTQIAMGNIPPWEQKTFAILADLCSNMGEPAPDSMGSEVTTAPPAKDGGIKKLGLGDRVRINMLYQQAVNERSFVASLCYALFSPKRMNSEEIQNFGKVASAIVEERAELSRPQEMTQFNSFTGVYGEEILPATSEPITGANFFDRTQCDSKAFFQLLRVSFAGLDTKLKPAYTSFTVRGSHVEIDSESVQQQARILEIIANSNSEASEPAGDAIMDEGDEMQTEEIAEDLGIDPTPEETAEDMEAMFGRGEPVVWGETPNYDTSAIPETPGDEHSLRDMGKRLEQIKTKAQSHGRAKDDSSLDRKNIPTVNRPDTPIDEVVAAKSMAIRVARHSGTRRRPAALADDATAGKAANPTDSKPPSDDAVTVEDPPESVAQSGEHGGEPKIPVDTASSGSVVGDTIQVDAPQLIQLDLQGVPMAKAILGKIINHGSCIAKGHAHLGSTCTVIDELVEASKGKTYPETGYDESPEVKFFQGLEQCFDIEARCDSGSWRSDYYYTFILKDGFKIVKDGDDNFFIKEKVEDEPATGVV
jgi:hypothetical protein